MQTNFETLKRDLIWGTYGKGGVEHCAGRCPLHRLQWVKLIDRETSHLQGILRTQSQIVGTDYQRAIRGILEDRGVAPEQYSRAAEDALFAKMRAAERRFYEEQRRKSS